MHITTNLGMATKTHLGYIASFWDNYIVKMGFKVATLHTNPGGPDTQYHAQPLLVELGLRDDACCYELVFHRESCIV